jgi:hypothetical protein
MDNADTVLDFETTISVTGFRGVPAHRNVRRRTNQQQEQRALEHEDEAFVELFYTQAFRYRTTDSDSVTAAYLVMSPFANTDYRASYTLLLHDSIMAPFLSPITGVSEVDGLP